MTEHGSGSVRAITRKVTPSSTTAREMDEDCALSDHTYDPFRLRCPSGLAVAHPHGHRCRRAGSSHGRQYARPRAVYRRSRPGHPPPPLERHVSCRRHDHVRLDLDIDAIRRQRGIVWCKRPVQTGRLDVANHPYAGGQQVDRLAAAPPRGPGVFGCLPSNCSAVDAGAGRVQLRRQIRIRYQAFGRARLARGVLSAIRPARASG